MITDEHSTADIDALFHRIGELTAQIGRYDLALLSVITILTPETVLRELAQRGPLKLRVASVKKLIDARRLSDDLADEFCRIHRRMKPVLKRFALLARETAIATQPGVGGSADGPAAAAHDARLSIDGIERDIITVLRQCIALSNLSLSMRLALACDLPPLLSHRGQSMTSH